MWKGYCVRVDHHDFKFVHREKYVQWRCDTGRLAVNVSILFLVPNLACFDLSWNVFPNLVNVSILSLCWVEMIFQNYIYYLYDIMYISLFPESFGQEHPFFLHSSIALFVDGPSRRYYIVFLESWPDDVCAYRDSRQIDLRIRWLQGKWHSTTCLWLMSIGDPYFTSKFTDT